MGIDYQRFDRVCARSEELANRADVHPSVKRVYTEKLAAKATRFRSSHKGLKNAETAAKKERREALAALEAIHPPYMQARSVAANYVTDLAIPVSLKSLSTETDKCDAIRDLLAILDTYDDEPGWASELVEGDFGRLAPEAIREVSEWIEANAALEKAVRERAEAYAEAYPAFLRFRDVVRTTYSPSSMHYRRLVVRSNGKLAVEDPVDQGDGPIDGEG
ncbi:MAG TPA: hypothetical protein VIL20_05400 [Sandaracinaceae bacterium]